MTAPQPPTLDVAGSGVVGVSFGPPPDTGGGATDFPLEGFQLQWEGRSLDSDEVLVPCSIQKI